MNTGSAPLQCFRLECSRRQTTSGARSFFKSIASTYPKEAAMDFHEANLTNYRGSPDERSKTARSRRKAGSMGKRTD